MEKSFLYACIYFLMQINLKSFSVQNFNQDLEVHSQHCLLQISEQHHLQKNGAYMALHK